MLMSTYICLYTEYLAVNEVDAQLCLAMIYAPSHFPNILATEYQEVKGDGAGYALQGLLSEACRSKRSQRKLFQPEEPPA